MIFIAEYYLWIKALHIIAFVSWMAGLLYLPRLFVYHAENTKIVEVSNVLKTMEYKLLRYITTPAMIFTWGIGILLLFRPGFDLTQGWIHVKIVAVLLMSAFHGMCAKWMKDFKNDSNKKTGKFYRIVNEIPTVLLITIVLLAIVKPF